jgi:hypothetical protein
MSCGVALGAHQFGKQHPVKIKDRQYVGLIAFELAQKLIELIERFSAVPEHWLTLLIAPFRTNLNFPTCSLYVLNPPMTRKACRDAGKSASSEAARGGIPFNPVPLRHRRDGWTPERQVAFIRALAECGCVLEACRRVGMSSESAYKLARRPDAQSFRVAWTRALASPRSRQPLSPEPPSPKSSTSAAGRAETNGKCPGRQVHQLPQGHQLPAGGPLPNASAPAEPPLLRPAYSLESFIRVARRSVVSREPWR